MQSTSQTESSSPHLFKWYLGGMGAWFSSLGLQMVMFPYLVTIVLEESAFRVGLALTALMAPSLVFMIFGGAFADRRDTRGLLMRLHTFAAIPPLILAAVIYAGELRFEWLIVFGLVMGTLSAFAIPARDSLLTNVAAKSFGPDIQRAVTLASGTQFLGQLGGIVLAGLTAIVGAPALLIAQCVIMFSGTGMVRQLPAAPPIDRPASHPIADMRDGIREVTSSPVLLPIILSMFAVGVLYVGTFMVLLPLMVRDYHDGGAAEISLINICFWGGTILATFGLLGVGHIHRRGLVLTCSLSSGLVILFLLGVPSPFWVMCLLCFMWGLGAGTSMTMSRTIVQLAAPPSHRARVLAIFQLGFAGGGPVGAFLTGIIIAKTDIHMAAWIPAGIMLLVLLALGTATRLASINSDDVATP